MAALLALAACAPDPDAALERAVALQEEGRFAESVEPLEALLERQPGDPRVSYRLGMALLRIGRPHEAVWPLERAAESPELRVPAGLLLATAFQQTQSFESAARAATRVLEHAPDSIAARVLRAIAYEANRRLEDALADAEAILERQPDHFQALLIRARALVELGRLEEAQQAAEALHRTALATDDPAAGAACLYLAHYLIEQRKDLEAAEPRLMACLDAFPNDFIVLDDVTRFYDARGQHERANEILEKLARDDVSKLFLRSVLAQRLRAVDRGDEGLALLRTSAETLGTPAAWRTLASYHLMAGELEEALAATERAVEADASGDEGLRFFHGEILVESGRLDEAEAIAASLKEPAYRDLLRGHVLYERGDLHRARAALDAGLALWPNHAGARRVAAEVAMALGDFDAAEAHYLEAVRATDGAHPATLDLVRLLLSRGDAEAALHFARMAANHVGLRVEAHLLAAQASAALGKTDEARRWLKPILDLPSQRTAALVALASLDAQERGPRAAIARIEESGVDLAEPENERVLRVWAEQRVAAGEGGIALARVEEALARRPEAASLHDLRGRLLLHLGRTREARAAFERALELEPEAARPLEGLAIVKASAGEIDAAVSLLERADRADPEHPEYLYRAARLLRDAGRTEEALHRLDDLVRRFPGAAAARNDLAWILAERSSDLDYALELARAAVRIEPRAEYLDTLGFVALRRGQTEEAIRAFQHALEKSPDHALIRYHLGLALAESGAPEPALEALRAALDAGLGGEADVARAKIAELEHARPRTP